MILSMTGFGHSVIDTESGQLSATIRSVNSRYLDIKIRGLHIEPKVEQNIRQLISENIIRGSVQVFFEIGKSSTLNNSYSFNKDRFEAIDKTIKMISQNYSYTINPGDFIHSSDLLLDNRSDDLNSDDIVNVQDIIIMVNIILGIDEYDPLSDLNEDGITNVLDIIVLVNIILEEI